MLYLISEKIIALIATEQISFPLVSRGVTLGVSWDFPESTVPLKIATWFIMSKAQALIHILPITILQPWFPAALLGLCNLVYDILVNNFAKKGLTH